MWLKGYHYRNDRNKSMLSRGWCQWKGIITSSGKNILVSKHTSAVFITFYSTCVSKKIWCVRRSGGVQFVMLRGKNHWFYLFNKSLWSKYIFIKFPFMIEHFMLPSTQCFSLVSQWYLAPESANQNLSSKAMCLNFKC